MSAYRKQVDKEHIGAYVLEGYDPMASKVTQEEEVPTQVAVDAMFKMDEELSPKPPYVDVESEEEYKDPVPSLKIPHIPVKVLEILKDSSLSKVMKNKVMDLPEHYLEDIEKVEELVELLQKKTTFKKSIAKVYDL